MATVGQVGEVITEQLRERVDQLVSAIENDTPDFSAIATVADAVGEFADTIAEIYTDLEHRQLGGLNGDDGNAQQFRTQKQRSRRQQASSTLSESAAEDVTKDELLEQARELHVEGRSSMTKEELAQAVEAEENVTKEELVERAREANVEGRSSMTKEELRAALHEGGA
jgi:hypothetical protein